MRLLSIEDERPLGQLLVRNLGSFGLAVDHVESLGDARVMLDTFDHDLILLDLRLPDGRGIDRAGPGQARRSRKPRPLRACRPTPDRPRRRRIR